MLYYNFKNYDEFQELFGIVEHGNGVKSRKNKILLSLYKNKNLLHRHVEVIGLITAEELHNHYSRRYMECKCGTKSEAIAHRLENFYMRRIIGMSAKKCLDLLLFTDIVDVKMRLLQILQSPSLLRTSEHRYRISLMGKDYYSDSFETDDFSGLCEDGTVNAIRYRNVEKNRVFKMKAGKMFNHLMSCNTFFDDMTEQIKRWLSEEWVAEWIMYAKENVGECRYKLHIDDNFEDIYSRSKCKGYDEDGNSFGSCMVGDDQWHFYEDSVTAKAAYLTDDFGMIVARCILFTDVTDEDGKTWRLAERQYSAKCDPALQRQLISALIAGGHIDGYKKVGASCSDSRGFVDIEGNSLSDKHFQIECNLSYDDIVSYQDSFKWYDMDEHIAYNYEQSYSGVYALDITSAYLEDTHEDDCYSEFNGEWIDRDEAYYVDSRDDYFYSNQVCYAYAWNGSRFYQEYCFEDDCVEIGGEYYYAGRDADDPESNGLGCCPECNEYFRCDEECYSEITEEYYCCNSCREDAEENYKENYWTYSEYDDDYYEDSDDVLSALQWDEIRHEYREYTIFKGTFSRLVTMKEATVIGDVYYIDSVGYDGEPIHYAAEIFSLYVA